MGKPVLETKMTKLLQVEIWLHFLHSEIHFQENCFYSMNSKSLCMCYCCWLGSYIFRILYVNYLCCYIGAYKWVILIWRTLVGKILSQVKLWLSYRMNKVFGNISTCLECCRVSVCVCVCVSEFNKYFMPAKSFYSNLISV